MTLGRKLHSSPGGTLGYSLGIRPPFTPEAWPAPLLSIFAADSTETTELAGANVTAVTGQALTVTRNAASFGTSSGGVLVSVPINRPRVQFTPGTSQLSLLLEASAVNLCLQSSTLTNASWIKSNMSTAKTAIGPSGIANTATICTATATDATVLQTITVASATRSTSVYLKRRAGTGVVEITRDNGATWIDITTSLTTSWTRFTSTTHAGLSTTAANPIVGLRIGVNGDAVDVAYFQDEAGAFATSPIETTTVFVTRGNESATVSNPLSPLNPTTWSMGVTIDPNDNWGGTGDRRLMVLGTTVGAANTAYINISTTRVPTFIVTDAAGGVKTRIGTALANDSGPHRIVVTNNAGALEIYVDGVVSGISTTGTGTGVITTQNAIVNLTDTSAGARQARGVLSDIKISDSLSGSFSRRESLALAQYNSIVAVGDSVTAGAGLHPTYPQRFAAAMGSGYPVVNAGVGGLAVLACRTIYRLSYTASHAYGTVVLLCGVNDLRIGSTAASTWATLSSFYDEIRYNGQRLVPVLVLPFKNFPSTWTPEAQVELESLNSSITSYATTHGLALVDAYSSFGGEGGDPALLLSAYDSGDHLHLNQAGANKLAALVTEAYLTTL